MGVASIKITRNENYYEVRYTEQKSNNKQPGLKAINKEKKVVLHMDPVNQSGTFTDFYFAYLAHSDPDVTATGPTRT